EERIALERLSSQLVELRAERRAPATTVNFVAPLSAETSRESSDSTHAPAQHSAFSGKGRAADDTPTAPPSSEQQRARDGAGRTIDRAIARGRLALSDLEELKKHRDLLAERPEETAELTQKIFVAINTNRLVPTDPSVLRALVGP